MEHGWPTDAEVFDTTNVEGSIKPQSQNMFRESANYCLWGSGRSARNIERNTLDDARRFDMIEAGLNNYIEHIGKDHGAPSRLE